MRYEHSWDSLIEHPIPKWLLDGKFGIYAHWGPYSVPAFGNEHYGKRMHDRRKFSAVYEHHRRTYGNPAQFGYKDFIPRFKAEKWDPDAWAQLIHDSGAKFAGLCVIHHDGFAMWHTKVNRWNAGNMGPKRDLYGELVRALRAYPEMRIIAAFHHFRTFDWFLPEDDEGISEGQAEGWDIFDPEYADFYWNRYTGSFEDFLAQWQAKVREVIDTYDPDILWFDGGKFREANCEDVVISTLAYYFNQAEAKGKRVEVLNKYPGTKKFNFPREFGVLSFEEGRDRPARIDRPWIDDLKISNDVWGYVEGQTYKTPREILCCLVDFVSRGGGLLLSLSPRADGSLTPEQVDGLKEIGAWLQVNGEAIYGTRPWKIHAEGDLEKLRTKARAPRWKFTECDSSDIRFTAREGVLYAIALGHSESGTYRIESLRAGAEVSTEGIARIALVGAEEPLAWTQDEDALTIQMPSRFPHRHAYAFRIDVNGPLLMQ